MIKVKIIRGDVSDRLSNMINKWMREKNIKEENIVNILQSESYRPGSYGMVTISIWYRTGEK